MLNKGLNHALSPFESDKEQVVVDIESSLNKKSDYTKTAVRNEVKSVIREMMISKSKKKSKKCVEEYRTIVNLRKKDVYYLKADKGNSLVIMDKSDYKQRMRDLKTTT